ncbi:uncharacterized protein EI90DRAFT_1749470 [Cantharellus anzutake]|uniref:uncharacterized protein n=1 Tax=Cantharellus anzutake TaxID=1750568 RepID=UPI001908E32F|nr:uncharacterized protein EI90DRAFT_1749470 [Cantharellus anzutake]KAF8341534.1 hypothetical protein EI90DRAFT_1749470 [Cantharellus anzutake]
MRNFWHRHTTARVQLGLSSVRHPAEFLGSPTVGLCYECVFPPGSSTLAEAGSCLQLQQHKADDSYAYMVASLRVRYLDLPYRAQDFALSNLTMEYRLDSLRSAEHGRRAKLQCPASGTLVYSLVDHLFFLNFQLGNKHVEHEEGWRADRSLRQNLYRAPMDTYDRLTTQFSKLIIPYDTR